MREDLDVGAREGEHPGRGGGGAGAVQEAGVVARHKHAHDQDADDVEEGTEGVRGSGVMPH